MLRPSRTWLVGTYPRRRIFGSILNRCLVMGNHSMLSHHGMAERKVHLGSLDTGPNEHRHKLK